MKNIDAHARSLKIDKLDEVFDVTLRSLRSKNARLIFKIFYDQKKLELTTLDLQNFLEEYNVQLNKKELHNWLISLMYSGLIKKSEKRGKPTTIPYKDRYSFDLWMITQKGEEIAKKLNILLEEYPNLIEEKIITKTIIPRQEDLTLRDFKTLSDVFYTTKILMGLYENNERIDSVLLSNLITINYQIIIEKLEEHMKNNDGNLYQIREKKPSLSEKIFSILSNKPRKTYWVEITENGKNIVRNMFRK